MCACANENVLPAKALARDHPWSPMDERCCSKRRGCTAGTPEKTRQKTRQDVSTPSPRIDVQLAIFGSCLSAVES